MSRHLIILLRQRIGQMTPLLLEGCHLDCVAFATFQRCMMSSFFDLVEEAMEIFMDDFSVYGSSFEN